MSSFKLYLPSNACPNVYPNNTPTDFRTVFDKPIEVEGNWEVGLESISYSSQIHDDTEAAEVALKVGKVIRPLLNSQHAFSYRLKANNTWPGYAGALPSTFEPDQKKLQCILNALNSLNDVMLPVAKAFHFRRFTDVDAVFEPLDDGLFLSLSPRLKQVLGFDGVLGQHSKLAPYKYKAVVGPLTQEDYRVRYLNIHVQRSRSITLKWNGTPFDGKEESFIKLWKDAMPSDMSVAFNEQGKLVVTTQRDDLAIEFSPEMRHVFHHRMPIIGKGTTYATAAFHAGNRETFTHLHWYINIYSTEMSSYRDYVYTDISVPLMPWKSNTIRELLHVIRREVEETLKRKLKRMYHTGRHHFSMRLQSSQHVVLTLGKRLEIDFSPNLAHLLGFPNKHFDRHETHAVREVDSLFNRARQLHVLTNIVQPTAVGKQQLQILRDFVHHSTGETLSVKRFDTISYVPLRINRIDNIHVQLVNAKIETVKVDDTKTLVTLYFRKI